ncbi:phage head-tail connector protein [Gemella sp. zg-1178]|uniref:phage head-tail connector protein n=1 Tax=Gemella sp. zg-1178 TaxID=2840372 RepID=UPI001C0506A0|nr:phage head-tail connector protein [Gemella sp. zg-1178]MBU0279207.1 hypothetical protein [Gemella sp. zg-1178]
MREEILNSLKNRPGVDGELLESLDLYSDAIQDILEFCNIAEDDIKPSFASLIKDLIMYRYNTLGVEGLRSESYPSVSFQYERDIPPRIKTKLRKFRRLSYELDV